MAVRDYAIAMDSFVVAFTSNRNLGYTQGWDDKVLRVPIRPDFLGRAYAVPESGDGLSASRLMLSQSSLAVLHLLYRYHIPWASTIAYQSQIPYWIVPHGILDPHVFTYRSWTKKIWLKVLGSRIMQRAEAVVFVTERERQKASPYTQGCKTQVIHLPVEYVDTSRRERIRLEIRARHIIPEEARVLVWMGRLHPMKRILETIDAFGHVCDPSLHLLIIGPDDVLKKEDCENYCLKQNIKNVHLLGPVYGNSKYDYYMASDGFISLSYRENFNYTLAEALACGLPAILSPGNDLALDLHSQNCGWMLKTEDAHEAITAIKEFALAPQAVLHELGTAGQQWARTNLDWETFTTALRELAIESTNAAHS
ncbi:MAG: glycosyltransferase [Caldilineaceae bacterium]|nr:glycosyltransferase [Caldilineaceae bacterium]